MARSPLGATVQGRRLPVRRGIVRVGAGLQPVSRSKLRAERLAVALEQALHDEAMQRTAAGLGE